MERCGALIAGAIFIFGGFAAVKPGTAGAATHTAALAGAPRQVEVWGRIVGIRENRVSLLDRTGRILQVDASPAQAAGVSAVLYVGAWVDIAETLDRTGVIEAQEILRAKASPSTWRPDAGI